VSRTKRSIAATIAAVCAGVAAGVISGGCGDSFTPLSLERDVAVLALGPRLVLAREQDAAP